ncbi:MAG: phosphatase PAP2 family protein [Chitinophagaceae bacterium]|nr:MAG: phosphatase PAP2 family protein [Chitinophagaceae bacterium]
MPYCFCFFYCSEKPETDVDIGMQLLLQKIILFFSGTRLCSCLHEPLLSRFGETRTGGGARNSFPSGHPAVVATSTFFMAKVYSDYHPEMKNKWILYSAAGAASLATGILRIRAGQHFPTDVMVGIPLGVLSGILVPHFHKNKSSNRLTLLPYSNGDANGMTAIIKL